MKEDITKVLLKCNILSMLYIKNIYVLKKFKILEIFIY